MSLLLGTELEFIWAFQRRLCSRLKEFLSTILVFNQSLVDSVLLTHGRKSLSANCNQKSIRERFSQTLGGRLRSVGYEVVLAMACVGFVDGRLGCVRAFPPRTIRGGVACRYWGSLEAYSLRQSCYV